VQNCGSRAGSANRTPDEVMTPERWQQIEDICHEALERPIDERTAYVNQACAGDEELKREVASLLAAAERDPAFLETPAARVAPLVPSEGIGGTSREDAPRDPANPPDERIGPYRIIRSIGRGGMGQVWLAARDDEAFTRYVALKVIRRGLDTDDVLGRFRAERQILASFGHENIARLFDGGATEDGRPYFVMEYVEGRPITEYCDRHCLSVEDRLHLFGRVCRAVHHAHRNLVVHRDLKPSNILVTSDGVPKLLDFGIAKILDPGSADVSVPVTRTDQRLLTPEYASPEQVRGDVITTASDVYALGVLLYELLTGRRPYRIPGRVRREIERVICEEQPTRPSDAVTQMDEITAGDTGKMRTITPDEVSAARATRIDQLRRRLSGDLDTIVMMTMRKEPGRRYGSAEQLAEDVRRHLDGLPVIARSDTMSYRASKFVRRHRWGVLWAGLFAALLLASTMFALWQANTIRQQVAATEAERDHAEEVSSFLMGVFEASDPAEARGDTLTALELLERGTTRIRQDLGDQPERQADMMGVMSDVYLSMGRHDAAERLAKDALDIQREIAGDDPDRLSEALARLGNVQIARGAFEDADSLLRRALDLRMAAHGPDHADVAATRSALATLAFNQGEFGEAERLYREAIRTRRDILEPDDADLARTLSSLGVLLRETGETGEAESLYREALRIQRRAFGPDHPEVVRTLNNLAVVLRDHADLAGAEQTMRDVLDIRRRILGPDHPDVGTSINNLAVVLREQGKLEEAEPMYREALELHERIYGQDHPNVAVSLNNLGRVLQQKGEDDTAEPYYRRALEMRRRLLGDEHPSVAVSLNNLASLQRDRGRLDEARGQFEEALGILRAALGDEHVAVAIALNNLARTHYLAGRNTDAEATYRRSLDVYDAAGQGEGPRATGSMIGLGLTLLDQGRPGEALPHIARADSIRSASGIGGVQAAEARAVHGVGLWAVGKKVEARSFLESSLDSLEASVTANREIVEMARRALDDIR